MKGLLIGCPLALALWLIAVPALQYLLTRPVLALIFFVLVFAYLYSYANREKGAI